jgi:flagellar protein FliO/FliZ
MDSLFSADGSSLIVRFAVAFVIVLALIGLTFWLIRRFGTTRVGAAAQRGRQPRLAVIDAAPVDGRRRLVLVRRDNVEHLLMIGGPSDIVVEMNIVRAVPVNAPRDVPVPRQPGAEGRPEASRALPLEEEAAWEPPGQRAAFRPEPRAPRAAETRPFATEPRSLAPEPRGLAPEPRGLAPEPRGLAPEPRGLAPEPRSVAAESRSFMEPSVRPPMPAGVAPVRPIDSTPIVPAAEPAVEPAAPDAALANMAQRLEAALRRPGPASDAPRPQPAEPAFEFAGEPPRTGAPDTPPPASGPKSKSVLDSLEQEMASLLGRPPEKQ